MILHDDSEQKILITYWNFAFRIALEYETDQQDLLRLIIKETIKWHEIISSVIYRNFRYYQQLCKIYDIIVNYRQSIAS